MCSKFQGIIRLSLPGIICARVSGRSVRPSVVVIKSNGCGPALDLTQVCSLSKILFVIFMERISVSSQAAEDGLNHGLWSSLHMMNFN